MLNASIDGNNIIYHNEINIGIAVALENGLIVPVIRNADEKNVLGLQRSIVDLATRARSRQLKPDEVQGGTFSITNFGSFGSVFATPVINQPQVAILGVGAVEKVPVVIDDAIAIRSQCLPGADLRPPADRRRAGRSVHGEGEAGAGELVGRDTLADDWTCIQTRNGSCEGAVYFFEKPLESAFGVARVARRRSQHPGHSGTRASRSVLRRGGCIPGHGNARGKQWALILLIFQRNAHRNRFHALEAGGRFEMGRTVYSSEARRRTSGMFQQSSFPAAGEWSSCSNGKPLHFERAAVGGVR